MDSSTTEVGSTEDIVKALFEYLVAPLLPLNTSSARATPSVSQQESVAKQMHATVLLYNYYQRKRHPELQLLDFESFCKLAVTLKPSLMLHMKFTHHLDLAKLDDLANQLSRTETAIMNACSVSRTLLDASKDVSSSLEEWPIIKVAVLLVDSIKENCLLIFGSITNGVWSVIEKDLDPEDIVVRNKRKRLKISKPSLFGENEADDEAGFQRIAFSAVKEKAGIDKAELKVLERNVVFTLSKEKTVTRFYIVQCTQPNRKDIRVPIKDAIDSLQGPLVVKSSGSWIVTPVVEYFHLLPYARVVSNWYSRVFNLNSMEDTVGKETVDFNIYHSSVKPCEKKKGKAEGVFPNTLGDVKVGLHSVQINTPSMDKLSENDISDAIDSSDKSCLTLDVGKEAVTLNLSEVTENLCDKEVILSRNSSNKVASVAIGFPKQKDCEGSHTIDLSNSTSALRSMDIDENPAVRPTKENINKSVNGIIRNSSDKEYYRNTETGQTFYRKEDLRRYINMGNVSRSSPEPIGNHTELRTETKPGPVVVKTIKIPGWLPRGWSMEIRTRNNVMQYKCFVEPESGRRFYSKPKVFEYLENVNSSMATKERPNADPQTGEESSSEPDASQRNETPDWLPDGWTMELKTHGSGKRKGKTYKCFVDPETGRKFFSKPHVYDYLKTVNSSVGGQKRPYADHQTGEESSPAPDVSQSNEIPEWLPNGWTMEVKTRGSGKSKGRMYKCFVDRESGRKLYSKRQVYDYLKTVNSSVGVQKRHEADHLVGEKSSSEPDGSQNCKSIMIKCSISEQKKGGICKQSMQKHKCCLGY